MASWGMDELGNLTYGGKTINFNALAKIIDGAVYDINGNPIDIAVADAAKLEGKTLTEIRNMLGKHWISGPTTLANPWIKLCTISGTAGNQYQLFLSINKAGTTAGNNTLVNNMVLSLQLGDNSNTDNMNGQLTYNGVTDTAITSVKTVGSNNTWDIWVNAGSDVTVSVMAHGVIDEITEITDVVGNSDPGGYSKPIYKTWHAGNFKSRTGTAMSKMLQGNLGLSNLAPTQVYGARTYIGNGSNQNIILGDADGPELVTNGTFDTDISEWTGNSTTPTYDTGRLLINADAAGDSAYQAISIIEGKKYLVKGTITLGTCFGARIGIGTGTASPLYNDIAYSQASSTNTYTFNFTAPLTGIIYISLYTQSSGTVYFDNISVKEITNPIASQDFTKRYNNAIFNGPELITNGTFETVEDGIDGHDNGDGTVDGYDMGVDTTLSILNNKLLITNADTTNLAGKIITTEIGKVYKVKFDLTQLTSTTTKISLYDVVNTSFYFLQTVVLNGTIEYAFMARSNTTMIYFDHDGAAGTKLIDNFSVKEMSQAGYYLVRDTANNKMGVIADNETSIITGDTSTFTTGIGSWVLGSGSGTLVSENGLGKLTYATSLTAFQYTVNLTVGKRYVVRFKGKRTASETAMLRCSTFNDMTLNITSTTLTEYTWVFTATQASNTLYVRIDTAGTAYFDDIEILPITDEGIIDFKGLDVHIKSIDIAKNNWLADTLRGVDRILSTNTTGAELYTGGVITSFTDTGIKIGTSVDVNTLGAKYICWYRTYNKIKWSITNHGTIQVEMFDATTNRGIIIYEGSGIAGHEIPHSAGVEPQLTTIKNMTSGTTNWIIQRQPNYYLRYDTAEEAALPTAVTARSDSEITISSGVASNESGSVHIMYYQANSKSVKVGTYKGTGVAGNEINVGFKTGYLVVKSISLAATDWMIFDNKRDTDGILDSRLQFNLSDAETVNTIHDFVPDASKITINSTAGASNGANETYLYIAYADTNLDGGGSYENLPSDITNLVGNNIINMYANGYDTNGAINPTEIIADGIITPSNGWKTGLNYVKFTQGVAQPESTLYEPCYQDSKFTGFGDFFKDGKWYKDIAMFADDFEDGDYSGWNIYGYNGSVYVVGISENAEIINGELKLIVRAGYTYPIAEAPTTLKAGKKYRVYYKAGSNNTLANNSIYISSTTTLGADGTTNGDILKFTQPASAGLAYEDFVCTSDNPYIQVRAYGTTVGTFSIYDDIAIIPLNDDGTVNLTNATEHPVPITYVPNIYEYDGNQLVDIHNWNPPTLVEKHVAAKNGSFTEADIDILYPQLLNFDKSQATLIAGDGVNVGEWLAPDGTVYGFNSNGEYTKLISGEIYMTGYKTITSVVMTTVIGSIYRSAIINDIKLPHTAINGIMNGTEIQLANTWVNSMAFISGIDTYAYVNTAISQTATITIKWTFAGRWKELGE